jgi:hypothetical protein
MSQTTDFGQNHNFRVKSAKNSVENRKLRFGQQKTFLDSKKSFFPEEKKNRLVPVLALGDGRLGIA